MVPATVWIGEMVERINSAPMRARRGIFEQYAERTGKSVQHLYRIAKENGFRSGRKKRVDAGTLKSDLADEQVEYVAGLIEVTRRENKGSIMPVERALEIAVDNNAIEDGQISVGGMHRILNARQLSAKHLDAPEPHAEMRSLHPNHVHAFDVSICIQYYLKNGRMAIMDERDFYKNKPHNYAKVKARLMRYVLVDHFSGAFFLYYYEAAGENQTNLYDFLCRSWAAKDNQKLPFRGVPNLVLMDRGSANTSKAIIAMLGRLGVEVPEGNPYNPRKQGVVEGMHSIIERWFESGLRIQPAHDVATLNEWALDWMVAFQGKRHHTRHGHTRTQCWLSITREQLREIPERAILQDLFANPEETRKVDGRYRISYRGNEYDLRHVEGLFPGAKVQAVLKPWTWPVIEVRSGDKAWDAEPISKVAGGFTERGAVIGEEFKPVHESETQKARKRIKQVAYGGDNLDKRGEPKKGAVPYAGTQVFGNHADKVEHEFIPRLGTPMEITREGGERMAPVMELIKLVRKELGTVPTELNGRIRRECGEAVKASELDSLAARYSQRGEHRLEAM